MQRERKFGALAGGRRHARLASGILAATLGLGCFLSRFPNPDPTLSDDTPPPLVGPLVVHIEGCTRVLLEWPNVVWPDPPEDDESGLLYYRIYRNGFSSLKTRGGPVREWSDKRNYRLTTQPEETVTYGVTAVDFAGNESLRIEATVTMPAATSDLCRDTTSPDVPTLITDPSGPGSACNRGVQIRARSTDRPGSGEPATGISHFEVWRSGRFMSRFEEVYAQTVGQAPGETYTYRVYAVDRAGNKSTTSEPVEVSLPSDCQTPGPDPRLVRLLVLPVFPADAAPPAQPASAVYELVRGGPSFPEHPLVEYFDEVSYGHLQLVVTDAAPTWVQLPEPGSGYCSGTVCNRIKIRSHALAATGSDASDFDVLMLVNHQLAGQFAVMGTPALVSVVLSDSIKHTYVVAAHELGHVLGGHMEHSAGDWLCPGRDAGPGFPNAVSDELYDPLFGCNEANTYGDRYSTLGRSSGTHHLPMFYKWMKGLLRRGETLVAPSRETEFWIHPAEQLKDGPVLRHVVVPRRPCEHRLDDTPYFSIEYRTPTGFDANPLEVFTMEPPIRAVQVRLVPWMGLRRGASESVLLANLEWAPASQRLFRYAPGGIEIELLGFGLEAARVRVRRPWCWPGLEE